MDGKTRATVDALAKLKKLDAAQLRKRFGARDGPRGVEIPSSSGRVWVRIWLESPHDSIWRGSGEIGAFVDDRTLADARVQGVLVVVEGPSDVWTFAAHGIAALGVPGASSINVILPEHVAQIWLVEIIREPDAAGENFCRSVVERLREIGYAGDARIVDLHKTRGVKDPSDLHVRDPDGFDEQWRRATDASERFRVVVDWQDTYAWPKPMRAEAFYGLAGEFVGTVEPHTEADKHALLANLLSGVSAMIGPRPYIRVGAARQPARINALIVGETGTGRKGTARAEVMRLLRLADEKTFRAIATSGLTSGEGLIRFVRDDYDEDGTPRHKRAWLIESEFSRVMAVARRDGSIVSQIIRQAFDDGDLSNLNKEKPLRVYDAHVCISTDCTPDELRDGITDASIANGYFNRYPVICSERTKLLPFGGDLTDDALNKLATSLGTMIEWARTRDEVKLSCEARPEWDAFYRRNEQAQHPPLLLAATRRAAQYVLRVALVQALVDGKTEISADHLRAAIAFWDYSFESARHVFGSRLGDARADALLDHLRSVYPEGLTGREIDEFFGRLRAGEIERIRAYLTDRKLVAVQKSSSGDKARDPGERGGRPRELWRAVPPELQENVRANGDKSSEPTIYPDLSAALQKERGPENPPNGESEIVVEDKNQPNSESDDDLEPDVHGDSVNTIAADSDRQGMTVPEACGGKAQADKWGQMPDGAAANEADADDLFAYADERISSAEPCAYFTGRPGESCQRCAMPWGDHVR